MKTPKILYHAYELYSPGSVDMYVHIDLAKLMVNLATELNDLSLSKLPVEGLTIGQVRGKNPEDAMDQMRASKWLKNKFYGNVQNPED